MKHMRRSPIARSRRARRQGGFSLLEIAIALPIIAILLLIVVEGVWTYAQRTDIRDSAEEGAHLAAGNFGTPAQIGQAVCDSLEVEFGATKPRVTLTPGAQNGTKGDTASITVQRSVNTLTGLIEGLFLEGGLSSTAEFTLTRPENGSAQWWADGRETTYLCPQS